MGKEKKKKRFLDRDYAMMRYKEGATVEEMRWYLSKCAPPTR